MINENERNKIIENMKDLLEDYKYDFTIDGIEAIVDEWAEQKETLIEAFKTHPNYVDGEFFIKISASFERGYSEDAINKFQDYILKLFQITKMVNPENTFLLRNTTR